MLYITSPCGLEMKYGDIQGKGKIYSASGDLILTPGEKVLKNSQGMLHRGWIKYKLGWRTIMFKGYGVFNFTDKRIIYLETPEFIKKIHTFNVDHELGDFGGWDYHAHRMRRAAAMNAYMFLELPYSEITKFKHKDKHSIVFIEDNKNKYKIIVAPEIGQEIEKSWNAAIKNK